MHRPERGDLDLRRLPLDVLALIASTLPFLQRLAFLNCCTATRALYKAAQRQQPASEGCKVLWPQLSFSLSWGEAGRTAQLASWLGMNKGQLHTLQLCSTPRPFSPLGWSPSPPDWSSGGHQEQTGPQGPACFAGYAILLAALAGSSIRRLNIMFKPDLHLCGWLWSLPQLEHLCVTGGKVVIGCGMSQLPAITSLALSGGWERDMVSSLSLPADLLSPRLHALELSYFDAGTLAALTIPAGGLPRLRSLVLQCPQEGEMELTWLTACSRLTRLHLYGCQLSALPPGLTDLAALQDLRLQESLFTDDEQELASLAALKQLTRLDLSLNSLTLMPGVVLSLPALQRLDISCNALHSLPFASTTITSLALNDFCLLDSLDQMTGLIALRLLRVQESYENYSKFGDESADYNFDMVCDLLRRLAAIPTFQVLVVPWQGQGGEAFVMVQKVMEALDCRRFDIDTSPDEAD